MQCKAWGLKVSHAIELCHSLPEVHHFLDHWDEARHSAPIATDGVVLKVDSISEQEELGYTSKTPRWAIAYKFQAEQVKTTLLSVDFQVGRTGAVTPVANLEAVPISGTIVRRASLHNADFITTLGLHLGDQVFVEKGGEIIPKIVGVAKEERQQGAEPVIFPTQCPSCSTPLQRNEGEAAYYCPNQSACPPQQTARIEHFCGRKAADIRLGEETISLLFEHDLVHSIADLYRLRVEDLLTLPGFKERSATKLLDSITASKDRPFSALLFGLGIRFVGETVAKTLVQHYSTIEELAKASLESNRHFILELEALSLPLRRTAQEEPSPVTSHEFITGRTFVISGVFTEHSREEYKAMIESYGGKISSSISSKTDFVLAGANMGPAKLEKATSLGITLLSETDFLAHLHATQVTSTEAPAPTSVVEERDEPRLLFD